MKKQVLILLFVAGIGFGASAQVQKGTMLIDGSVGFYHSSSDDDVYHNGQITGNMDSKVNRFTIIPRFGFFAGNSFLVGLGAGFEYGKQKNTSTDNSDETSIYETKSRGFIINPYLSKYFKIGEKLYITGTFNMRADFGKNERTQTYTGNENENYDDKGKNFGININVTPGLTYFLNKSWALSGKIGRLYYNWSKSTLDNDEEDNPKGTKSNFGIDLSFNTFTIGIQYYLHN